MSREVTWSNLGVDVLDCNDVDSVLLKAKLNYEVEKQEIMLPSGIVIQNKYATVRKGTEEVLGVVGSNYTICQNTEAFDFINYLSEDIQFVRAGETHNGLVYIIAKLPEQYVLEDSVSPYIIFINGHNGLTPVKAAITPVRIWCQNQFNMIFKTSDNSVVIRHASTIEQRLYAAKEVFKTSVMYMDTFKKEAEMLSKIKLTDRQVNKIIESTYKLPPEAGNLAVQRVMEKREELLRAYKEVSDNQNFRGTAWGMLNAYTDVLTHSIPTRMTENWEEKRFQKVTLDSSNMDRYVELLRTA